MVYCSISHILPGAGAFSLALFCLGTAPGSAAAGQSPDGVAAQSSQTDEARDLNIQGMALLQANNLDAALSAFNPSLDLYRKAGDLEGEAKVLTNIGLAYSSKGEWEKASDSYIRALRIFRTRGDRASEADLLIRIAFTFDSKSDHRVAADYYEQAIPLLDLEGDRGRKGAVVMALAVDFFQTGRKQRTVDLLLPALPLLRSLNDPTKEGVAFELIAMVFGDSDKKREALGYYKEALDAWRLAGNRERQVGVLGTIAGIETDLGSQEDALRHYDEALSICKKLNDLPAESRLLGLIGALYSSLDNLPRALAHYEEALSVAQKMGDPERKASSLDDIGFISLLRGQYDQAISYFSRSLQLWIDTGNAEHQARTLSLMGAACDYAGYYQPELDYLKRSLAVSRTIKDPAKAAVGEADALSKLGMAYATMIHLHVLPRSNPEIQEYLNQAIKRIQGAGSAQWRAVMLGRLGLIHELLGNWEQATAYNTEALRLCEDSGEREGAASALYNLGFDYELQNKPPTAIEYYQRYIEIRDTMRVAAHLEEIKTGISASSAEAYKRAAALLNQIGDAECAFEVTEHARARAFLDQLGNLRPRPKRGAASALLEQEQTLRLDIGVLERRLQFEHSKAGSSFETGTVSSIQDEIKAKRNDYEDLLTRLKLADPEYASMRAVSPPSLQDVQPLIAEGTTLISYFVTDDKTLAFIITRNSFKAFSLPTTERELRSEINWFRQFPRRNGSPPESLKELHGQLIAPLLPYIKTTRVAIVPSGVLNYLPFAVLTDGSHYFGEEHAIYYLPSAAVLRFSPVEKTPLPLSTILAVGLARAPGLPGLRAAEEEANTVAAIFGAKPFVHGNMSKAEFVTKAGNYGIVHIAAHGELDSSSPLFSRIYVTAGSDSEGALSVHEVYDMDLSKTSLVVLSGCETQLGAQSEGDDVIGLNRAFLYAGAASVVASLWTVDDRATALLMRSFYTHIKRGLSKVEALRAAQSETREQYPDPYYWAAFVLTGDPGPSEK